MCRKGWKLEVLEEAGYRCKCCGSTYKPTVHHKLPVARHGKSNKDNGVCWCDCCHKDYHKEWGLTESDDYGNPIGDYHSVNKPHKKHKKHRR